MDERVQNEVKRFTVAQPDGYSARAVAYMGTPLPSTFVKFSTQDHVLNVDAYEDLSAFWDLPLAEFFTEFAELYFVADWSYTWLRHFHHLSNSRGEIHLESNIWYDVLQWRYPYTIDEHFAAVQRMGVGMDGLISLSDFATPETADQPGFMVDSVPRILPRSTLRHVIEPYCGHLDTLLLVATRDVATGAESHTLTEVFEIPSSIRTACVQYLSYFAQFLRDLGVDAETSIGQKAGQVLFSVTPTTRSIALENIQTALAVYLSLPDMGDLAAVQPHADAVAVSQLQANVMFLKSQLALASATIQAKDATVIALSAALQLKNSQSGLPVPKGSAPADAEPLLGGLLEITSYEGKGYKVNLAELLRRLRRRVE